MESQLAARAGQQTFFVEHVPTAIAMFDTEMRYLAVSRSFLSLIEFSGSPAEVIGRSHYETFPDIPPHWREYHARVLAGEHMAHTEESLPRRDGRIDWVRWSMKPWRTADGGIGGALLAGDLITDEVKFRHAVAESEVRFRATFENAAVGIAHLSCDMRWLRANQALCRIVGWPINELVTKSLKDISHPDDLEIDLAHVEQIRLGKINNYDMEKRYRRRDGAIIWAKLTVSCVRKSDGSIDYFVAIVEDISSRKFAEVSLQRQAELLDQSHDAIFTWKIGGGITYWSRGAETLYGVAAADAMGRCSHELLQTRSSVPIHEIEARIARSGSWYGELIHTARDGREIVVESRHVRVIYDGQSYTLETNRDITARKYAEEQVLLLMREANHRVKNLLALVQVIARQTAAGNPEDFARRFGDRIQALAANQELLGRNQHQGADLDDLVRTHLAHFADLVGSRITVLGPKLRLNAAASQAIGLTLHELATNAGKYGALSTDMGRVDVGWTMTDDTFTISWIERNGPPVRPPERKGFGSTVIDSMAGRILGSEVQLDYAPTGLEWRLTCLAANALEGTVKLCSKSSNRVEAGETVTQAQSRRWWR
jgi:PAS domain S-box-containing protein